IPSHLTPIPFQFSGVLFSGYDPLLMIQELASLMVVYNANKFATLVTKEMGPKLALTITNISLKDIQTRYQLNR
ncbi:hypothetical protein CCACVL1_22973, partial [Corchorus capsularis]